MSEPNSYVSFEAVIEAVKWGRSTYTVLILPEEVAARFLGMGAKRVEGEIDDHPVNLGLSKADAIPGTFLWTGKSLLEAAGIEPGKVLDVRLRMTDPNAVDVPQDVTAALMKTGMLSVWEQLTPGKQRGLLHQVTSVKRAETRAKRITKLIEELA